MAENPTKEMLEIAGSVANFAGGLVLLIDAFRVRKVIRVKKAGQDFQEQLRKAGVKELDMPVDERGNPLGSPEDLEMWLAEGTFRRSWWGFALLVLGFACELLSHRY